MGGPGSFYRSYASNEANYTSGLGDNSNITNWEQAWAGAVTNYEGGTGITGGYTRVYVDAQDDDNLSLDYAKVYVNAGATASYSKTSIANYAKNYGGTFARQWSTVLYYIGYYTGVYTKQYTKEYAKVWTGQYEGVFTASYTGQYLSLIHI